MDIFGLVTAAAAEFSLMPQADMLPEHTLFGDIDMDGDDFTFEFVPTLEKTLRIKTLQSDWDEVRTVRDAVVMLQRKMSEKA